MKWPFARLTSRGPKSVAPASEAGTIGGPAPLPKLRAGDVVRLRQAGRPLARVGQVLADDRAAVWILKTSGGPARWTGPKVIRLQSVSNNYGPLDDVGIGAKMTDHL